MELLSEPGQTVAGVARDLGLIGSQYARTDFQELLAAHGIECSMSGPGRCYDNAAMKCWFGLLKRERVNKRRYRTRKEARHDVFDYIERFYNRRRPHGSAGRMRISGLRTATTNPKTKPKQPERGYTPLAAPPSRNSAG